MRPFAGALCGSHDLAGHGFENFCASLSGMVRILFQIRKGISLIMWLSLWRSLGFLDFG